MQHYFSVIHWWFPLSSVRVKICLYFTNLFCRFHFDGRLITVWIIFSGNMVSPTSCVWLCLGNKSTLIKTEEGSWFRLHIYKWNTCLVLQVTVDFISIKPRPLSFRNLDVFWVHKHNHKKVKSGYSFYEQKFYCKSGNCKETKLNWFHWVFYWYVQYQHTASCKIQFLREQWDCHQPSAGVPQCYASLVHGFMDFLRLSGDFLQGQPYQWGSWNSTEKTCGGGGRYVDWEDHVKCSPF